MVNLPLHPWAQHATQLKQDQSVLFFWLRTAGCTTRLTFSRQVWFRFTFWHRGTLLCLESTVKRFHSRSNSSPMKQVTAVKVQENEGWKSPANCTGSQRLSGVQLCPAGVSWRWQYHHLYVWLDGFLCNKEDHWHQKVPSLQEEFFICGRDGFDSNSNQIPTTWGGKEFGKDWSNCCHHISRQTQYYIHCFLLHNSGGGFYSTHGAVRSKIYTYG